MPGVGAGDPHEPDPHISAAAQMVQVAVAAVAAVAAAVVDSLQIKHAEKTCRKRRGKESFHQNKNRCSKTLMSAAGLPVHAQMIRSGEIWRMEMARIKNISQYWARCCERVSIQNELATVVRRGNDGAGFDRCIFGVGVQLDGR
jgi:hypothetical protein